MFDRVKRFVISYSFHRSYTLAGNCTLFSKAVHQTVRLASSPFRITGRANNVNDLGIANINGYCNETRFYTAICTVKKLFLQKKVTFALYINIY